MTSTIGMYRTDAIELLESFLARICGSNDDGSFVWRLAKATDRWSTVQDLITETDLEELQRIAFRSRQGGFSPGNLKAHYVLDEDFINDGTAFILFALVGSRWTHVISIRDQNRITSTATWLQGQAQ